MISFSIKPLALVLVAACLPLAVADPALDDVIESYEAFELKYSPSALARSEGRLPDAWPDVSPENQAVWLADLEAMKAELDEVDTADLTEDEAINRDILDAILTGDITLAGFDDSRLPFTGDSGFHTSILFQISNTRIADAEGARATIRRIEAIPEYLSAHVENMKRGIETGFVAYTDPLETVIAALETLDADAVKESGLYAPFESLPKQISEDERASIEAEAKAAIKSALEAFEAVETFLKDEYRPAAREQAGIVDLPKAQEYYKAVVAYHTTLPEMTPEMVHELGKSEVARIRSEMDEIIQETGFEGSFAEFLEFLRTDPQFYASTPEELMAVAARFAKDLDFQMPRYFGHLPRLPYGVEPVPASIAPGYTTGRYVQGDLTEGRAGQYWVNTHALDQRPLYELPSLTAHEAVPGHHQQIAVAQELENVPGFRQDYYATAFGEGWGLYSETLAGEMGLYKTPYERFGKLSYEMWRACRLVADTGLHWYGWSREEAEACFLENSALAPHNIKTEVTRYIGWPGQAVAYKIGELKIKELRALAEDELGEDFDIRAFHDVVLEKGALPLKLLEARVRNWIAETAAGQASE